MWFYRLMISQWGPLVGSAAIGLVFLIARGWMVTQARVNQRKRSSDEQIPVNHAGHYGDEMDVLRQNARLCYEQICNRLVDQLRCAGSKFNHILAAANSPSSDAGIGVVLVNGTRCFRVDCPDDMRPFDQFLEEVEAASEFFHAVPSMQFRVLGSTPPGIVLAELKIERPGADQQHSIAFDNAWEDEALTYYGVEMDKGVCKPINFIRDYLQ